MVDGVYVEFSFTMTDYGCWEFWNLEFSLFYLVTLISTVVVSLLSPDVHQKGAEMLL